MWNWKRWWQHPTVLLLPWETLLGTDSASVALRDIAGHRQCFCCPERHCWAQTVLLQPWEKLPGTDSASVALGEVVGHSASVAMGEVARHRQCFCCYGRSCQAQRVLLLPWEKLPGTDSAFVAMGEVARHRQCFCCHGRSCQAQTVLLLPWETLPGTDSASVALRVVAGHRQCFCCPGKCCQAHTVLLLPQEKLPGTDNASVALKVTKLLDFNSLSTTWSPQDSQTQAKKQTHISKLFSYRYINFVSSQPTKPITSQA